MSTKSVIDLEKLIKTQVSLQEAILERLFKIEALLEAILVADFTELPKHITHDFLWAVTDVVQQAKNLNELVLDLSLKASEDLAGSGSPPASETIH